MMLEVALVTINGGVIKILLYLKMMLITLSLKPLEMILMLIIVMSLMIMTMMMIIIMMTVMMKIKTTMKIDVSPLICKKV